ncbi:MAG: PKD domain-containing protein [Flavitalea sp.]
MTYKFLGPGATPNTSRYLVELKLYLDCNAMGGQLDDAVPITIFNKETSRQFGPVITAGLDNENTIRFDPASNPCISNAPVDVCYRIRTYSVSITLPDDPYGYVIAYQRCCRIENIINLAGASGNFGATYYAEIPGTDTYPGAQTNSSPIFTTSDAVAVCGLSNFTVDYSAFEQDGDSIAYRFCSGFVGASQGNPTPGQASAPAYRELSYQSPYGETGPFGPSATINPRTGLVTGIAPEEIGQYVITVCAYEYRKGVLINVHRKDIHVKVSDCIPLAAVLKPDYSYCDDFNVSFKNEQINPSGSIYIWNFGDNSGADTSADPEGFIQHRYADSGTFKVKLKVILAGQCVDSTTTLAKVYPGFYPGFTTFGTCQLTPIQFFDTTKTRYGSVTKWSWDFADQTSNADTSRAKNTNWKYGSIGFKNVQLIVESDKGCIDTVYKNVEVRDKPPINLPFKDTLICSLDTLQLQAIGNGIFSWAADPTLINSNSATPLVFPKKTTTYQVSLNENGCVSNDLIRVRVVDFVTLDAGADSIICLTDTVQLRPITDGLQFSWSPAASLNNATVKNPLAVPTATTIYQLHASIGKCNTTDNVTLKTVPYPFVYAGTDTVVCFEGTAQLNASITAFTFTWNPVNTLSNPGILNPLAFPPRSTTYTLVAYDTLGCPKPGIDQVKVTVRSKINAFAGNDTAIVVDQPLQLSGSGAEFFRWSPGLGLNNTTVSSPIAMLKNDISYVMQTSTAEGCFGIDTIHVRVFKTKPDIFVPNAFSPNGRNKLLRPIPVGISNLEYFRVYNRWGQLVFQSNEARKGWDGTLAGKLQDGGTYVWMVQGKDFTGKTVSKKGTAILIR